MHSTSLRIILVFVLLMTAAGCSGKQDAETETDFTKIINVEIYTAQPTQFIDYVTLPVVVLPNKEVNLGLTNGGKITKIHVDKGDKVHKDMVLLETDNVLLKAAFDQAQANLNYQETEYARSEQLFDDGSITAAMFDVAKLQFDTARSSFDMAKKQLDEAVLKAPFGGIVTVKHVEVGDILGPGSPAFRVIDVDRVKVQAGIPEKYVTSFKVGNIVSITFDAIPDKTFKGKINYISPESNPSVRTFLAEMIVENREGLIRAGIMGNAKIQRQTYENVIMIPINAIIEAQNGRSVFIARDDNTAEERLFELGESSDETRVLVKSGIDAGEKVIVKGQHDLVTGERINVTGEFFADRGEESAQ